VTETADRVATASGEPAGVEGNSRLTAGAAALLLVLLAVEGVTVLSVEGMLTIHVFVGMVLVPVVVVKVASTTYRFWRYYTGRADYVRRGPPHPILRVLGPFVSVLTVALLATGIVLIVGGRSYDDPWRQLHKLTFIAWFLVMTVHVLGHIVETARVAPRDWTVPVRGTTARRVVLIASLVAGIALGLAFQGKASDWRHERGRDNVEATLAPARAP
jgi:hypothetical protein